MKHLLALFLLLSFSFFSYADNFSEDEVIPLQLTIAETPNAVGSITAFRKVQGAELLILRLSGLPSQQRLTVFLTQSSTLGATPAQFIGEVRVNNAGNGIFDFNVEVENAFVVLNPSLSVDGVADVLGAGLLAGGSVQVPTNFIRLYFIDGNGPTAFGQAPGRNGGLLAGTTLKGVTFP